MLTDGDENGWDERQNIKRFALNLISDRGKEKGKLVIGKGIVGCFGTVLGFVDANVWSVGLEKRNIYLCTLRYKISFTMPKNKL